jgi:hypothetical protein
MVFGDREIDDTGRAGAIWMLAGRGLKQDEEGAQISCIHGDMDNGLCVCGFSRT